VKLVVLTNIHQERNSKLRFKGEDICFLRCYVAQLYATKSIPSGIGQTRFVNIVELHGFRLNTMAKRNCSVSPFGRAGIGKRREMRIDIHDSERFLE